MKTKVYSAITIIYNPNSTGGGKAMAHDLRRRLKLALPKQIIHLKQTKYQKHATELAYAAAKATKRPLVISVSGDGGYREVVNGLMQAQAEGAAPVAGLLPAGNANDHYRNLHDKKFDLVDAITRKTERTIDLLTCHITRGDVTTKDYAHSYIGLGLTAAAGYALNQVKLNRMNEVWIVLQVLFHFHPARLIVAGYKKSYDSLIFSNIASMSKVISLSREAEFEDGKFEVTMLPHRHNRLALMLSMIRATIRGFNSQEKHSEYIFQTRRRTRIQLDGEVMRLEAHSRVRIGLDIKALRCIAEAGPLRK